MSEQETAIAGVEIIVAVIVAMLLVDYLGYKIDRWRLVALGGIFALVTIVVSVI